LSPRVIVDPGGFAPASDIPPPKISDAATLEQFQAFRWSGDVITTGCVSTSIPGWVEDMRPAIDGRTVALAGASAALSSGKPIDARSDGDGGFQLRVAGSPADPPIGNARTFVGFHPGHVDTCFATCIGATCRAAVDAAHLDGSSPPPRPGLVLGGTQWAVHHPTPFATAFGAALFAAGALAVTLRRRPRSRSGALPPSPHPEQGGRRRRR
jgi:hypothetical protein